MVRVMLNYSDKNEEDVLYVCLTGCKSSVQMA
jgi:hypothetical protein